MCLIFLTITDHQLVAEANEEHIFLLFGYEVHVQKAIWIVCCYIIHVQQSPFIIYSANLIYERVEVFCISQTVNK